MQASLPSFGRAGQPALQSAFAATVSMLNDLEGVALAFKAASNGMSEQLCVTLSDLSKTSTLLNHHLSIL
jgi:hypothetical protein